MAQRLSGFARKPVAAAAAIAATDALSRAMEDDAQPGAIPLELSALIAPYRKHGRLSLRVERLPPRARLSRGHNNGDRSWSLMSDELDGLTYLPPGGAAEACTLAIRIVSLDGGDGATLALFDYPVAAQGAARSVIVEKPFAPGRAPEVDQAELRRLRDELARSKARIAEQEVEFGAARLRWEDELKAQLAASSALAAETLERGRAAWQAEQTARATKSQPRPDEHLGDALARAEKEWKAAEAVRLATAEARWENRSAKALADARAQLEKIRTRAAAENAREKSDEAERRRLRDEVARLKKSLAARESEFAEAREAWRRESEEALAGSEQKLRDREAHHLATAKSQWQTRSERALAEATAQFERAQTARAQAETLRLKDAEAEAERLKDDLASANQILADRENDIADLQSRLDEHAVRANAIEAQSAENARLKNEFAGLRAIIAERERDIVQARAGMEQARLDWRKESEARFAEALAEWKKGEAARILAAEALSQEQSEGALTRVAQRLKQVENELRDTRAQAEALRQRGDSEDIRRLRREFGHLQAVLAERETEVAQLRLDSEHARERWTADARITLQKAEHDWKAEAQEAERRKHRKLGVRRTARDIVLAASLSVVAVMAYLHFDLASLVNVFPPLAAWIEPSSSQPVVPASRQVARPAPAAAALQMATALHAANVRAAPSKTAEIVATLPRDSEVSVLDHHGNWVRVKIAGARTDKEGWVYATYLREMTASTPAPTPQRHT